MSDAKVRGAIQNAREHLDALERDFVHARANLYQWGGIGYPPGGGGGGGSGGHGDPVQTMALRSMSLAERDGFVRAYNAIEYLVVQGTKRYELAHRLSDAALNNANLTGADGCASCDRGYYLPNQHSCSAECAARDHQHRDAWQQVYKRVQFPDDPPGRKKTPLCSFCADWYERYDELPVPAVVLWHLEHLGTRVPFALVREHHPAAYERHHGTKRRRAS